MKKLTKDGLTTGDVVISRNGLSGLVVGGHIEWSDTCLTKIASFDGGLCYEFDNGRDVMSIYELIDGELLQSTFRVN